MATIDNNTPQGEPVCDQQPISVQPGLAVILDTREIAKITEIVRKARQSISPAIPLSVTARDISVTPRNT